jgi:hypothetical protein
VGDIDFSSLKNLHDFGFALHWLKPKSKAPVHSGWTSGPRLSWEDFKAQYRKGYNVGVRLGRVSEINGTGFLGVIDVDVKDPKFCVEAIRTLQKLFPNINSYPKVLSGRGNGSCHYYVCLKDLPVPEKLAKSERIVKVKMPSVAPSSKEKERLSEKEIAQGIRLRPAFEISLMTEGRQVVLPPSVHPDSGQRYVWASGEAPEAWDLGVLRLQGAISRVSTASKTNLKDDIHFEKVDVESLGLAQEQVDMITDGEGVEDRSASIFSLCMSLASRKVSDHTIVSLFTDTRFFLGQTAFDHAKTKNRRRAANWFWRYCLEPAKRKANESLFDFQKVESVEFETEGAWQKELDLQPGPRGGAPTLRPTFKNVKLILENEISAELLKRNLFTHDDIWAVDTPWGFGEGKKRSGNTDDALAVKVWMIQTYRLEVSVNIIDEVLNSIAAKNGFHPVKDFLEGLQWDGVSRVETAFEVYLRSDMDTKYLRPVCRKFFLGLIARIYEPGIKFDALPVLEGKQGIGKSTFPEILVGRQWFLDGLPDFNDKDAALYLQGIWICELSELSSFYRSGKESAKAFISRNTDKIRPPYGHRRVEYPRTCLFVGTTNDDDYLVDATGNRRFWPVKVHGLDFKALRRDRLQLLAEAKWLWEFAKEPLYLQNQERVLAEKFQEDRRVEDEYDGMRSEFQRWEKENTKKELQMEELFDGGGPFFKFPKSLMNRRYAGRVLRNANWKRVHTRNGKRWVISSSV